MSKRTHSPFRIVAIASLLLGTLPLSIVQAAPSAASAAAPVAVPLAVGPTVTVTAQLRDTLLIDVDGDGKADPGDTLHYTVTIANSGSSNATGVGFNLTLDSNTALSGGVSASPVAVNDTYAVNGNVSISVPAGSGLQSNDYLGAPTAALTAPISSTQGGNLTVNSDGSFAYNPPPGYEGVDTFVYTLTNATGVNTGTVTLNISGMIWFANNNAPSCITLAAGCGRLDAPFSALAAFQALNNGAGNNPATNDSLFIYSSASNYTGGVTLLNNQKVIGQGAGATLVSIAGITLSPYGASLPNTGGSRPTLTHSANNVTLATGNTVRGLDIDNAGGTALLGSSVGNLTLNELSVTNTNASCVAAVSLSNGNPDAAFTRVNATGCTNGIYLNTITGSVRVIGDGASAQNGSGGTISGSTSDGIRAISASNLQLARMNIQNSGASGIFGTALNGFTSDYNLISGNGNAVDEYGLRFTDLTGSTSDGSNPTRIANTTVERSGEFNINILNTSGALSDLAVNNLISRDTNVSAIGADGFYLETSSTAVATVNIAGSTFSNNSTQGIQAQALGNSTLSFNVRSAASTFSNNNEGIVLSHGGNADLSAEINGATFTGQPGVAIFVGTSSSATNLASLNARVLSNTVTSPASAVNHSIIAFGSGAGTPMNVEIANNTVNHQSSLSGIFVDTPDSGSTPILNALITNNTVNSNATGSHAILAQDRRAGSGLCVKAQSNTVTGINTASFSGVRVRQATSGTVNLDQGTSGSGVALTVLQDNNPAGLVTSAGTAGTVTVVASGTCSAPVLLSALPEHAEMVAQAQPAVPQAHHGAGKTLAAPVKTQRLAAPLDTVSVNVGTLPAGKSVTIAFNALVSNPIAPGVLSVSMQGTASGSNFSNVSTDDPDTGASGDATLTALDIKADVAISKSALGSGVPGQPLTYTLVYTNNGPQAAVNVVITDQLPVTLTSPSYQSSATITPTGAFAYAWNVGTLDVGQGGTITVSGIVSNVRASTFGNTATITGTNPDPSASNNSSSTNVSVPNIAPDAQDDGVSTNEDTPTTISVRANDSDLNNDALTVTAVTAPANGSVSTNGATVRYTPTLNFNGDDVFTYTLSDGTLTDTAQVTVTVDPVNDAPVANAGSSQTRFVDTSVALDGSASSDIDGPFPLSYGWQQVGGTAVSFNHAISQPTFTAPTAPTVLTFTLVVTDGSNLPSTVATTTVLVTDVTISGLSAINDGPTVLNTTTQFTGAVSAGSNVSYAWDYGDGATAIGVHPSHTYASVGTYTATVTATNSLGQALAQTSVTVFDVPVTGLSASNDSPTLVGAATHFTASISAGTNPVYTWAFGDGASGGGATPNHSYVSAGQYTATVTATNSSGSHVASTLVNIDDVIVAGLQATNDGPTALGNFTELTATTSAGTGISYDWDFGDGDTASGDWTSHLYAAVGTYTATVTTTNSMGNDAASTVVIVDEEIVSLDAANDGPTILGDATQFSATISTGSRVSYVWAFGDGSTATGATPAHSYAAIGTYTATVTATNSVGQQVARTQVLVKDVPVTGLSASNDGPNTVNQLTQLTATLSSGSSVSYAWDFGDGASGAGATSAHRYTIAGTYTATVTATNTSGSSSADTVVTVWPEPQVQLNSAVYALGEGTGSVLITVTLDVTSSVPVTVNYAMAGDSATAPDDFTALADNLVFAPGVTVQTFSVALNDDALDEPDETFTVSLNSPISATLGVPAQAVVSILDDDAPPTVQFSQDDYGTLESAGSTTITVKLSAPSGLTITVPYTVSDVSATSPADYVAAAGVLIFAPGQITRTFGVTLNDDPVDELDESVQLTLGTPTNASLGARALAMLTLIDDEAAPIMQFSSATYTANESDGSAVITVTLNAPSALTVTATYTAGDGSAIAPDDYSASTGVLTFAPGQITQTFSVAINDDALDELDEDVMLSLGDLTQANPGALTTATLTIGDNDAPPTVNMSAPTHSDDESAAQSTVHVSLDTPSGLTVTVAYTSSAGTATSPEDFVAATDVVTFAPGATNATIAVMLNDDALDELDETVNVDIGDAINATLGISTHVELMILDNDAPPTVAITPDTLGVDEGTGIATLTVTLDAPSALTVTVDYATADDSATAPNDYAAMSSQLVFAPGETEQTIDVAINEDGLYEGDEALLLMLSNAHNASLSATATSTITIVDNDTAPTVQFNLTQRIVDEAVGTVTLTATLDAPSAVTATVVYTLSDGSAVAPGDYVADHGTLTFAPGDTMAVVLVSINDDALDEDDEQLQVTLGDGWHVQIGAQDAVQIDIVDDDVAPASQFASLTYNVDEGAGQARITVTLNAPSGLIVTVPYTLSDDTATAPDDYFSGNGTLIFAPGETQQVLLIALVNDVIDELDETLMVTIGDVNSGPYEPEKLARTAMVTIVDNDSAPGVQFSRANTGVTEGDSSVLLTATLSAPSGLPITVSYASSDGTATAPGDYVAASGVLTFAPSERSKAFSVLVNDDTLDELNETFRVALSDAANATLATPATATVTLSDNDGEPGVSFEQDAYSVGEGVGSKVIPVMLDAASALTVTVRYTSSDGSAVAPGDYIATSGVLTFAPGVRTQFITLKVTDDAVKEITETLSIGLGSVTHAQLDTPNTTQVTIIDDDVDVVLPSAKKLFLPMLVREMQVLAGLDLIVQQITLNANTNDILVVIQNQGNLAVTNAFWVDLYVNPNPVPSKVNDIWGDGRSAQGATWGVTSSALPLAPSGLLTLTLGSNYFDRIDSRLQQIKPGDVVMVQVDSASTLDSAFGAVKETHELAGGAYNNIASVTAAVTVTPAEEQPDAELRDAANVSELPKR